MGLRKDKSGISVQLYDKDNNPDGPPHFGSYTELYSLNREEVAHGGMTAEEKEASGSEDWLTLIAVADSQEKLDRLVKESNVRKCAAHTSGSSHRVHVAVDVDSFRRIIDKTIVIASGPIVATEPPTISVVHVKVLHDSVMMTEEHPLAKEFKGMSPMLMLS